MVNFSFPRDLNNRQACKINVHEKRCALKPTELKHMALNNSLPTNLASNDSTFKPNLPKYTVPIGGRVRRRIYWVDSNWRISGEHGEIDLNILVESKHE